MNYCGTCGVQTVPFHKGFNTETGQPLYVDKCPKNCLHSGMHHDYGGREARQSAFGFVTHYAQVCKHCNYAIEWSSL